MEILLYIVVGVQAGVIVVLCCSVSFLMRQVNELWKSNADLAGLITKLARART